MRLSFRREFVEPILTGKKTHTIRGRCRVRAGDRIQAICQYNRPPFAELEVIQVAELPIAKAAEAWPDIRETYPGQERVFQINFRRV